jgi:hypothetical protein
MKLQDGQPLVLEIAGAEVSLSAAVITEMFLDRLRAQGATQQLTILGELRTTEEKERTKIGELGEHGIYAGIARGPEAGDDYILEVLEQEPEGRLTWQDAKKWAESVGGELPNRREAALLFANVPELFESAWYWTSEQSAGLEAYAWYQGFDYGYQDDPHKGNELRARAVRRLPLVIQ